MLLQIKCLFQGKIMVEAVTPYYFHKIHREFTDENPVFDYTIGMINETTCFTITQSYNKHGQDCIVIDSMVYDSIAESEVKHYYHPSYQSTKEQFQKSLKDAQHWLNFQQKFLTVLNAFPLP